MTRINCVPVSELTSRHLVAEYRELPRVFGLVRQAVARGEQPDDPRNPAEYTMGAGHIRFFYPRLGYLLRRQGELVAEMQRRGYRPAFLAFGVLADGIPEEWCRDWEPAASALALNRMRIAQRIGAATEPP